MTKTLASCLHLKQRLFILRMVESTSIKSHLVDFSSIIMNFENMDEKIKNEDQALLLLCSLLPSYKYFRETLIYDGDDISMNNVKSSLFFKDLMDKKVTSATACDGKVEMLSVRSRNMKQNSANKKENKAKCKGKIKYYNYCKKKRHAINECWKLQNKDKSNSHFNKSK